MAKTSRINIALNDDARKLLEKAAEEGYRSLSSQCQKVLEDYARSELAHKPLHMELAETLSDTGMPRRRKRVKA